MRGAIFFACCFLHYWRVVILTVEWIPVCVCLVSAWSSSWYVLYLFVRFSLGLLSTCVTTGWIFEISSCEDSVKFKFNIWFPLLAPRFSVMPFFSFYTGKLYNSRSPFKIESPSHQYTVSCRLTSLVSTITCLLHSTALFPYKPPCYPILSPRVDLNTGWWEES